MSAGQDPLTFGDFALRECQIIVSAAAIRDARLAWQASQYVRFAYHSPNEMPDEPGLIVHSRENREADVVYVKAWMRAMHNRSRVGIDGR